MAASLAAIVSASLKAAAYMPTLSARQQVLSPSSSSGKRTEQRRIVTPTAPLASAGGFVALAAAGVR